MAGSPGGSRRYSDEEVRYLLQRASEMESQGASVPARPEGPTLTELETIASEAGLDPSLLRRAARELDEGAGPPAAGSSAKWMGAPLSFELERVVPVEVPASVLERVAMAVQRAADGVGQPSIMGRTLSWTSSDSGKSRVLNVSVSMGGGETRLALEERYGNLAGGLFGGIMGGVGLGMGMGVGFGVGLGALGSAAFAAIFPLASLGGAYALARAIYATAVKGRMRTLTRLMDEMVRIVEDGAEEEGALEPGS